MVENSDPRFIISNAFSLNMLDLNDLVKLWISPVSLEDVRSKVAYEKRRGRFVSAVGHSEIASLLTGLLGTYIPYNRVTVRLRPYDDLVVAQYIGPRLTEGTTELPPGSTIKFALVRVWPE